MDLPPFQKLIDAHGHDVLRFLAATVGPQDAEDCWQETFLSALAGYPRLTHADNLRSWLFTIAHRKAMDAHRKRTRRAEVFGTVEAGTVGPPGTPDDGLWGRVRSLPPKQRAAVVHRYVNDLAYREIAQVMESTPEAARRNVHEGLKRLREAMA
jgi:DNA-directed RNA polymerase specialized sigma24 family protein